VQLLSKENEARPTLGNERKQKRTEKNRKEKERKGKKKERRKRR